MWQALIPILGTVLDKILPDPKAAADAKLKVLEMAQQGELAVLAADTDLAKGQLAVNAVEAASANLFTSGWRPFIGWTCGFTVCFKYILGPLLVMVAQMSGHEIPLPQIDASELWPVLMGMLGLGGMRTMEKLKGKA
jgi:hypothetical protein